MRSKYDDLAIASELPHILKLVVENQVVAVQIPTGCGKSIGIPGIIARETKMRLFCTQPTIASVIGLHSHQSKLMRDVGWAAEGTKKYRQSDRVVYATAGHIRRLLLKYFQNGKADDIDFCDVLMMDEIHTGSKDNSIIIDLLCEAMRQGAEVPKLILSTATGSGIGSIVKRLNGIIFTSTYRHSEVEIRYAKKNYEEPDDDMLITDASFTAVDLLSVTKTHGIVFCSGSGECDAMVEEISKIIDERNLEFVLKSKIVVLPCYAQCKREDITTAIMAAPPGVIHVVCGTNVVESSLTIPDVAWVVDTMTEKRSTMHGERFHLGVEWISKDSATQRAGRTGRTVRKGICQRMMTSKAYSELLECRLLEIRNAPITDTVIELLDVGLDPCKVITELDQIRLNSAKTTLVETGCIIIKSETSDSLIAEVTDRGRFVVRLPMDVRNASALHGYIQSQNDPKIELFWPIAALTIIDTFGPSLLWFPRRKKDEAPREYHARMAEYAEENFSEYSSECPIETLCNVFADCMESHDQSHIYSSQWRLGKWASSRSINGKKLKEICSNMKRICYSLSDDYDVDFYNGEDEDSSFKTKIQEMMPILRQALFECYKTKRLQSVLARFGPTHMDQRGEQVNVDLTKTAVKSHGYLMEDVISLSDIRIVNPKTGKATNISSLWFVTPSLNQ